MHVYGKLALNRCFGRMSKHYTASPEAQGLIDLAFSDDPKTSKLRQALLDACVYVTPGKRTHVPPCVVNGREEPEDIGPTGEAFVTGWRQAGGDQLWVTWHFYKGYWAFMFWERNPHDIVLNAVKEYCPIILI